MSITNRNLYSSALVHLGALSSSNQCEDYEERTPYILANFCSMSKATDSKIRKANGLPAAASFNPVYLFLEDNFPLCDQLVPAAIFYLAAMLVIDDDSELSDTLYDKYCDMISDIIMDLSCQNGKVTQNYFAN